MGSVTHTPKAGATLTGTEYEASNHHVIALDASDIPAHSHSGDDITSGTVADGRVASTLARDSEVSSAVSDHAALTTGVHGLGSASAVGIFVQAGDPGAVGAGRFWLDTSGNLKVRNSGDSAWIEVVSTDP